MILSRTRCRIPSTLARHSTSRLQTFPRRYVSGDSRPPAPLPTSPAPEPYLNDSYATYTMFAFDFFRRFVKITAIGLLTVSFTSLVAFEGAHLYAENVGLSLEKDEETQKWEWDLDADRWSGSPKGGTDPGLGFAGSHAVRSAWMVLNWGTGSTTSVVPSQASTGRGPHGQGTTLAPIQASLEYAQEFLRVAIYRAEQASGQGKLHPSTLNALLARRADVLERIGTPSALDEARAEYERIWANLPAKGVQAARIALKLGDLNRRLGDSEDALGWWARSLQLAQGQDSTSFPTVPPAVPAAIPPSPLAQRTLASALTSLSAFYATTGQLHQAEALEASALELLRLLPPPQSSSTTSPPEALHQLYIFHRSSILSIHFAEVEYALGKGPATSVEWLTRAAESSERVALSLTGLPLIHPDAPNSNIPHPPSSETPLKPAYSTSKSLSTPARALLRDARRTAAESWNLIGVLTEGSGSEDAKTKALECYERALEWAGVGRDKAGGIGHPGEGTLETEWKVFWANYVRAREAVRGEK